MLSERSTPRTKSNAAYEAVEVLTQAREGQEAVRRLHEQKCVEAAEAMFNGTMKDTPEIAEALEDT